uniref:glucuronosyltransferase n=1 Tax=Ditylenchus dipsaci TaxID=166011 RepID=A0A915CLS1_9BILA
MYQCAYSPSHVSFSGSLAEALIQKGHTVDKVIMEYNDVKSNGSVNLRNVFRVKMPVGPNPFLKLKHITSPFENFVFLRRDADYEKSREMLCKALITDSALIPSMVGYTAVPSMDGVFEMLGIPVPPSFVTSVLRAYPEDQDQLSFKRRVQNFLEALEDAVFPAFSTEQTLFGKYFPGFPSLQALGSKMSYFFVNTNEILDINKPISAKIKFVGGIAMKKPKKLDEEAEKVLSIPSKGVILFSFGSLVKTSQIPYAAKVEILKAFKEFPEYTFLWKYDDIEEDADLLRNYSNVYTRSWLQQTELLYDPRVKLFITHMGLNSYLELSHAGIPAVGIPVLGDQFYNTGCAIKNGVALRLDKTKLTKESMVTALEEMLSNPSYSLKAKQIAQMLASKPEKIDANKFTEYVEHAAQFPVLGSEILQMASAEMSVYKYACVDVMIFLLVCMLVALLSVIVVVRRVVLPMIGMVTSMSTTVNFSMVTKPVAEMATSAQRREQLEHHLQKFREIADQRVGEKIAQWGYHLPAMVSATIIICQLANTVIFLQFAYNFGQLYLFLDEYMRDTDAKNISVPNSTQVYRYKGINAERINEIDLYHDQLWTLFVAEIIELIFPMINVMMFAWIIKDKKRRLPTRVQIIYLLCPALALVLSVSQACTIHVTLTESIYTIRFLLAKLLGVLLELNKAGRLPIENFFECEFFNDDDIVKPPCAGQLHDTVVSRSTLSVLIVIHIIPVVVFIYLLLKNLTSNKSEHLFLYIESVDAKPPTSAIEKRKMANGNTDDTQVPSLKQTVTEMLTGLNTKFVPKKIFHEQLSKVRTHSMKKADIEGLSVKNLDKKRKTGDELKPETSL